ncbi:MAG: hypothetical protein LBQ44_11210 [Treponema sp.]|nr:hypothetical protein [Treponema sp.]
MKRILAILLWGIVVITIANAETWIQNFRQRGSATHELKADGLAAAHPSLPIQTQVHITNLQNNKTTVVTIVDRISASGGRIIDLSRDAADELGITGKGVTAVAIEALRDRVGKVVKPVK